MKKRKSLFVGVCHILQSGVCDDIGKGEKSYIASCLL